MRTSVGRLLEFGGMDMLSVNRQMAARKGGEKIRFLCGIFREVKAEAPEGRFSVPLVNATHMLARAVDGGHGAVLVYFYNRKFTHSIAVKALKTRITFNTIKQNSFFLTMNGKSRKCKLSEMEAVFLGLAGKVAVFPRNA